MDPSFLATTSTIHVRVLGLLQFCNRLVTRTLLLLRLRFLFIFIHYYSIPLCWDFSSPAMCLWHVFQLLWHVFTFLCVFSVVSCWRFHHCLFLTITNHFIMVSCSARWHQSCPADRCLWISVVSHTSTVSNCCHYFPAFHIFKCYHSCPARTFQVLQHPLDVFPTILGCLWFSVPPCTSYLFLTTTISHFLFLLTWLLAIWTCFQPSPAVMIYC